MTAGHLQLDAMGQDLKAAYVRFVVRRRRRRRVARIGAVVSALALALAGAGLATGLLGWPAPQSVREEIAAVDRGLPEDLRLNPDVENARAVAASDNAVLYAASLRDGGSCTEIVTDGGRGRGATCTTGPQLDARALELVAPFDDGAGPAAPVVLGGRLNAEAGASVEVRYEDGSIDSIPLGEDRYFLFEVPAPERASVHASGLTVLARDDGGKVVERAALPADWDDEAVPDEEAPLYVSTRSDESDFTKVYGIEGHVSVAGAKTLELDYGDGSRVSIPIKADGSYEYTVPPDRVGAFMRPRTLVARDASGEKLASAAVAAVACWRGQQRGLP